MTIETKFKLGDKAYILYNYAIQSVKIEEILVHYTNLGPQIKYKLRGWKGDFEYPLDLLEGWFMEEKLFLTKEELAENLLNF